LSKKEKKALKAEKKAFMKKEKAEKKALMKRQKE